MSTIAVVGQIASGKGAISDLLIQKGFTHYSYGQEIGKYVDRIGLPHERDIHSNTAELLRRSCGNAFLVKSIAETIDRQRQEGTVLNVVIDGVRHPEEIEWLRQHYEDLLVIGVIAPYGLRRDRFLQRGRALDKLTDSSFARYDARDRGVGEPPYGNHADEAVLHADVIIENKDSYEELERKLQTILGQLKREGIASCHEREGICA